MYEVVIEPPLDLASDASLEAAAQRLYGVLERDIYLDPASWNYWDRLHKVAGTLQRAGDEPVSELVASAAR